VSLHRIKEKTKGNYVEKKIKKIGKVLAVGVSLHREKKTEIT
jgi:hypothetical protein